MNDDFSTCFKVKARFKRFSQCYLKFTRMIVSREPVLCRLISRVVSILSVVNRRNEISSICCSHKSISNERAFCKEKPSVCRTTSGGRTLSLSLLSKFEICVCFWWEETSILPQSLLYVVAQLLLQRKWVKNLTSKAYKYFYLFSILEFKETRNVRGCID